MAFVQFTDVCLAFGARDLLKSASLYLAAGTRAALAGPNGTGKSTLMKIAVGQLKPDSGDRAITRGARISYLPQTGVVVGGDTVFGEAEKAFSFVGEMLARQDEIGHLLAESTSDTRSTARLLEEHQSIDEAVEATGYHRRADRIREVLFGLGFRESDFGRPALEFSGGWQMRVALARVLLENPDIMLLDEPTNYLDLEARTWLETFLASYSGGVLIVSHDRYFLDVTVKEVYELFGGKLTRYPGTYSQYEERRSKELDAIFESWERQQEDIQKLEDFIRRFRYKASKASQVQSRVKMLEKIVPIEIPEGMKHIHFAFPPAPHSGKVTLRIENLGKSYGENRIIGDFGVEIDRGMKVALVGPNGAGKSTLMRLIAGTDRDYSGSINFGSGVVAAYFAQDTAEKMEGIHTVEAELESVCPNELLPKVRNMLGAFLFRGDDVEKPLNVLSGGERSRLALLKMLLHPANLLILDEPTNHLDLTSKDVLLEALRAFQGTVLFVSHDRGFIEELADRVLELESGASPRLYVGDYRYYLEKKAALANEMAATPSPAASGAGARTELRAENRPDRPVAGPGGMPDTAIGSRKAADAPGSSLQVPIFPLSWEEEKARKARIRKVAKREQEILDRLESIGAQKLAAEREMSLPRNYSDGATMKKLVDSLGELEREAAGLNEEWILVAEELASLS